MRISEFVLGFKALSTRIRFDLKTQLFLYGYGFRPHESDENHQWKRNFSKTLTWVELYENTVLVCTCGQSKTELFENAEDTLSVPKGWWTGASLSCLLSLGLFLTSNCLFSSKFSFVNSSSWLLQKVTEHYQVSFATGVKRRKVGSPFSLTLFLPWIWHFKLFLRLWRTSQLYKPTPKKFKGGANLLFRGLIIANTYASSMRSRVSFRFQIDLSYRRIFVYTFCLINIYFWLCDDAKKIKKRWILKGHNSFSYLWKFEPNTPDGFGEMLLSKLQTDFTENHGSLTFLPHSNFAVFYGWYFLQYCLQIKS